MKWLGLVLWEVGNSWKFFCAITRGKKTKTRRRIGFVLFPCEIEKGGIFCLGPRLSLKKGKLNRGIICSGLVALWGGWNASKRCHSSTKQQRGIIIRP